MMISSLYRRLILTVFILFSGAALAQERQAVILMYHQFGVDKYPSTNIHLAQFEAHLQYLESAGYEVWPLSRVAEHIRNRQAFPGKIVAITIDDAYDTVYTEAYPRLKARGWPFTVFVATDGVDKGYQSYMTWAQMREMGAHGASFANHSASHDYLVRRLPAETESEWQERIAQDIERAQRRLKQELGTTESDLFAYPYGEYDSALGDLVSKLGFIAFGQHSGPAGIDGDLRALPRFPMAEAFGELEDFRLKLASLAFPIQRLSPWDPVVGSGKAPRMEIKLGPSDARLDQLACYFSAKGAMAVEWINRQQGHFAVQAKAALPTGRSRYNCTAPSAGQNGRFYWFSHLWIRLP